MHVEGQNSSLTSHPLFDIPSSIARIGQIGHLSAQSIDFSSTHRSAYIAFLSTVAHARESEHQKHRTDRSTQNRPSAESRRNRILIHPAGKESHHRTHHEDHDRDYRRDSEGITHTYLDHESRID